MSSCRDPGGRALHRRRAHFHRRHWLRAFEHLHMAPLGHAQQERAIRRVQMQPDDVVHLLGKEGISAPAFDLNTRMRF